MGERFTIHVNRGLKYQAAYGEALKKGLIRRGLDAHLSHDRNTPGDIHVVLGPWFALDRWRHGRTLYIDRAYWDDPLCVSIHWLVDGEKHRPVHTKPRWHPTPSPMKLGDRVLYLCDYNAEPVGFYHTVRRHPANGETGDLQTALDSHDIVVGRKTTALVDAAINGLVVRTDDPNSPVWPISGGGDRGPWLNNLAWHNWSIEEIATGAFIDGVGHSHPAY